MSHDPKDPAQPRPDDPTTPDNTPAPAKQGFDAIVDLAAIDDVDSVPSDYRPAREALP